MHESAIADEFSAQMDRDQNLPRCRRIHVVPDHAIEIGGLLIDGNRMRLTQHIQLLIAPYPDRLDVLGLHRRDGHRSVSNL
jgi:hypothetical protein